MNLKTVRKLEIILSGIFFGTIPIFSSFLHRLEISSLQQAFFRLIISIIIILIIIFLCNRFKNLRIKKADLPFFLAFGFFLSMSYFTYLSSISLETPVGEAVFLTYTQPLFAIILGKLILKESFTKTKLIASALSMIGVALILQIFNTHGTYYNKPSMGDFLAILNGLFYASYIITGRYIGKGKNYDFITTTFWSLFLGLVLLIPSWLMIRQVIIDEKIVGFSLMLSSSTWSFLFGLALFSTVLPYLLLNHGLKNVKASHAGILLLFDPISVVLMGTLILQETLNFWQMVGGFFIAFSVVMINSEE